MSSGESGLMVEEIEEIRWPVLVTQLDGGTILPFMGLDEMQGALESVDIENVGISSCP